MVAPAMLEPIIRLLTGIAALIGFGGGAVVAGETCGGDTRGAREEAEEAGIPAAARTPNRTPSSRRGLQPSTPRSPATPGAAPDRSPSGTFSAAGTPSGQFSRTPSMSRLQQ